MKKHLLLILFLWAISFQAFAQALPDDNAAVVVMYHRFGEDKYPSTNTTMDQLNAQLKYLIDYKYHVISLPKLIEAFERGEKLPPRTIAITIDDAFKSVFTRAYPRFESYQMPFTVFVSTGEIDKNYADYMSWDDLRAVAKDPLVTIANHGNEHVSFLTRDQNALMHEIVTAQKRFDAELGFRPTIISYPYGEFDEATLKTVAEMGFKAGFTQTSGAAAEAQNRFALPRFALNESYGDINRFALIIDAKPLNMTFFEPMGPHLETDKPTFKFKVQDRVPLDHLHCYAGGSDQPLKLTKAVDDAATFSAPVTSPLPAGRPRINCTLTDKGQWYWFGKTYLLKDKSTSED